MRVKILTRYRTDNGEQSPVPEKEVDDDEGRRLILGGIAEEVGAKAKRVRKPAEAHEVEVEEPDEGGPLAA